MESLANLRLSGAVLMGNIFVCSEATDLPMKDEEGAKKESLFMSELPREIHYYIFGMLSAVDLKNLAQTCKELKELAYENSVWKLVYGRKWLKENLEFVSKYYAKDHDWRGAFKLRLHIEKKYLPPLQREDVKSENPEEADGWKAYLRRGKSLAKFETEDLREFILIATVEQEQYKSAAVRALVAKKDPQLADLYYYWGRCIKDLTRDPGANKLQLLMAEEDKYRIANSFEPTDSYVLYSWAINLRFQLEHISGAQAYEVYKKSSSKYRLAMKYGYTDKYVLWGLGSLKLHMAKKQLCEGNYEEAEKFLQKAEKKYTCLSHISEADDSLTTFSLKFNFACVHICRAKIAFAKQNKVEYQSYRDQGKNNLIECSGKEDIYKEYLTIDLLDLWYFDIFRHEKWFQDIYTKCKPKRLTATW